jgi:LPS-assembly protein
LERKSGFLFPTIGSTPDLGFFGSIPYYGVIDESSDVTVTPYIFSKQNPVVALEGRKRFNAGSVKISTSVTRPKIDATTAKVFQVDEVLYKKKIRGHFFGEAKFSLNEHWRTSLDIQRASDQTYLKRYPFMGHTADPYLTSTTNTEYFSGRNYGAIAAYHFQGLIQGDRERRAPLILPVADYRFVSAQRTWGDYFTVDTNIFSMYRHEGLSMRRGVVRAAWYLPYLTDGGHSFLFSTSVRGDGYATRQTGPLLINQQRHNTTGRLFPQVTLEWRYPLVTTQRENKWIVEPIAQLVGAPRNKNPLTLANEDSASFELSDLNIFFPNRIPGYDRIDSGSRVNYGFQAQFNGPDVGANSLMLGQSYNFTDSDSVFASAKMNDKMSDYLGNLKLAPRPYLSLTNRFRFARKGLKRLMNESVLGLGFPIARLGVNYFFIDKSVNATGQTLEQAGIAVTSQFIKYWSLGVGMNRNLRPLKPTDNKTLSRSATLGYQDDCFGARFTVTENYYVDRDVKPGKIFMFFIMFKNLGAYSYGVNPDMPGPFDQK